MEPPANRPKIFFRGYDVHDPVKVGFVAHGAEAKRAGTQYDTSERASGNQGHTYGTDLPESQKLLLLEYLKTL